MNLDLLDYQKKFRINTILSVLFLNIGLIYALIYRYLLESSAVTTLFNLGLGLGTACFFISRFISWPPFVLNYLPAIVYIINVGTIILENGLYSSSIWWLSSIPLLSIYLYNARTAFVWFIICSLTPFVLYIMNQYHLYPLETFQPNTGLMMILVDLALLILMIYVMAVLQQRETVLAIKARDFAQKLNVTANIQTSLGQLGTGLAHEINNPLMVIKDHLDIIKRHNFQENSQLHKSLNDIEQATSRIMSVMQSMRLISGNPTTSTPVGSERVQLSALITNLSNLFAQQLEAHNIHFSAPQLTQPVPELLTRKNILAAALIELFKNSVEALSKINEGEKWIRIETSFENGKHYIRFIDSGESRHLDFNQLMRPFYTSKTDGHILGLGLNKVYSLVRYLEGEFYMESHPNTCFTIQFSRKSNSR